LSEIAQRMSTPPLLIFQISYELNPLAVCPACRRGVEGRPEGSVDQLNRSRKLVAMRSKSAW
jgi:hypothetical protein